MRVLHYITDFTGAAGPQASAARMMMFSTAKIVENHLVTAVPLAEGYAAALAEQCNVKVHYLHFRNGANPLNVIAALVAIRATIRKLQPDVVHVHGPWDWRAAMVERMARQQRIVTLVSPHRGLSQELISVDFWSKKLPCLMAYQAWMVRNCTAVIAVSEKEGNDILSLGLKKRIEVMPPMPREGESMEALRDDLVTVYRKALDSAYATELTQEERNVVSSALRAVIADDDIVTEKPDIQGVSFRRIFLHAYDEDVMRQLVNGCQKLQLPLPPPLNVAEVPRYRNPKAKQRGALKDANVSVKPLAMPADRQAERDAVMLISKAKALTLPRLTLRHYAELYAMFRHSDFDETLVAAELKRLHLQRFTIKLQKRLAEMFALRSGYDVF